MQGTSLPFPTPHRNGNGNASRSRRTRPEHVALHVERIEHLWIEIHPPREASRDETVVARVNGCDAADLPQVRQHRVDQIATRGNGQ
jgi:hypothetical protein